MNIASAMMSSLKNDKFDFISSSVLINALARRVKCQNPATGGQAQGVLTY